MLTVTSVTKKYAKKKACDNVNISINSGEVAVLLGPNGAGKSTLIKCICGLLRFDGEILIEKYKNKTLDAKKILGYIPEMPAVYDLLTVNEHLEFILRSYKVQDDGYGKTLLERFELWDKKDELGMSLSKGMQQKLSICCALVHKPKVIIFDEPMVGLDPHAIKELKSIISQLKEDGCSILISTHILDSIENTFDKAYIMQNGEIKAEKSINTYGDKTLVELYFEITEGGNAK